VRLLAHLHRPRASRSLKVVRIHVSSAWAPGSSGSAILDEFGNAIGLVSGIEMIQEPATKQTVMSVNRAARAADLIKLVKQPEAVEQ